MKKKQFATFPRTGMGHKLILKMKLTFIILLGCLMQVSASVYSQATKFSFNVQNQQVVDVLKKIEEKSDFRFFYQREQVDVTRKVDLNVNNRSVESILDELFKNQGVSYKVLNDNLIVLSSQKEKLSSFDDAQQQKAVSGKVTDSKGIPLPGVTVVIKGTTSGTITDTNGNYTLPNVPANSTLQFSFVGMTGQEIPIGNKTTINVTLSEQTIGLDEVVAIGYGTSKKSDLTGSVTNVSADRLLDKPAFNVAQAIGGKVAGVKIIERTGAPGSNPMIRVRGTNSINSNNDPLFVVDGVVGVANALTILNPNDIQSMDVLKDASATAIYGARGSNGVIIITTKRGISGKTQVEYNAYVTEGVMQRHMNPMNAEEFLYVTKQAYMNVTKYATIPNWSTCYDASILPPGQGSLTYSEMPWLFEKTTQGGYSIPLLGKDGNYYKPRFETNWEKEAFKPSTSTNHELSIRTGTDKARFGTFLGYSNNQGLLLNSYFTRFNGKLTGDITVNNWLQVSSEINVIKSKERTNDVSFFSGGMARSVVESYPILPVKFPDDAAIYGIRAGQYADNQDFPIGEVDCQSPVHISNGVETYTDRSQYTGYVTFNFTITKDLTFKTNFAVDANFSKYNRYADRKVSRSAQGSANINVSHTFYWQNENYFNYNKTFGDHTIAGMAGLSWSRYKWENLNTWNDHFFDDFYGWHNIGIGTASRPAPSSGDGQNSLNSYFARANYSYKSKYLMTLTGRVDGSSKFGANSKYGFFPSGSVAWRISEEDFAKSIALLSNAKLRFSVGQTGNQEIGSYVTQTFIGSGNVALGNGVSPGLWPNSVGNPDLRWEKTTQYDGGIDIGILRSRINMSIDYYHKLTTDMLLDVPLPRSTTTGSVKMNYGTIQNNGIEITLNTHNVRSSDFNWYTDFNFSKNKNKIVKLGPTGADILRNYWVGGANTILREGLPVAEFFGLTRLGTYSTQEASLAARYGFVPGDVKYLDRNNDGRISFVEDGSPLGSAFPKWDMDITNSLNYKNFDFSIDIRISYGAKKENRTNHSGEDRQAMANGKNSILNSWRPDHQNTDQAQVRPGNGGAYYQTYPDTHWIEDASFVRGDGMTLGYTFSKNVLTRLGVNKLRAYLNAENFFVITKYTGYDPEGSDNDNMDSITPGMDFFMYPKPTNYTFGVNVIF